MGDHLGLSKGLEDRRKRFLRVCGLYFGHQSPPFLSSINMRRLASGYVHTHTQFYFLLVDGIKADLLLSSSRLLSRLGLSLVKDIESSQEEGKTNLKPHQR
jgi:hypothetical protein